MPHCDTLNYYLEKLSPKCLADVRKHMVKSLIRMKSFNRARLMGKYWRIIIDGTGLFYFKEKHCGNCLVTTITREEDGKEIKVKRYYHKVLEAKLVLSADIMISLDTEFLQMIQILQKLISLRQVRINSRLQLPPRMALLRIIRSL